MKRVSVLAGAVGIFFIGFLIGQQYDITRIIAQDSSYVPTATLSPTPQPTPTPLPTAGGGLASPQTSSQGGPRNDIVEIQHISASQPVAQVGDDIGFTVTIKNQAPYKKLVKQLCFNSTDGNFGCTMDFNLYPGQSFNFNNSGRFTKGGVKTIWITWTQDGQNFYPPVDGKTVQVTIQN